MIFEYLELSRMRGAELHKREINGEMQDCISIPIRMNGLFLSPKKKVFLPLLLKERRPNPDNYSHYISLYTKDRELIRDIKKSGFEKEYKFLGSARIWTDFHEKNRRTANVDLDKAMSTDE